MNSKKVPYKEDYIPGPQDDAIVHEAYAMRQKELRNQIDNVQTVGEQKGFTKADCEDIVDAQMK